MKKLIVEMLLILLAGLVVGGVVHFSLLRRFFGGEFRHSFLDPRKYEGIRFIGLPEAQDLFESGRALFIDSRTGQDFAAGHIPGALSIPLDEIKKGEESAEGERGKSSSQKFLSLARNKTLVVYCEGGDCQTSLALARLIHDLGFRDIRVFEGGWAEWRALGLPIEESR